MNDAFPVGLVQRVGNLNRVLQRLIQWQSPLLQSFLKRFALDQLHDEVVRAILFADVVKRTNVGMIQAADSLGFTLKAFPALGVASGCSGRTLIATVRPKRVSVAL